MINRQGFYDGIAFAKTRCIISRDKGHVKHCVLNKYSKGIKYWSHNVLYYTKMYRQDANNNGTHLRWFQKMRRQVLSRSLKHIDALYSLENRL